MDLPYFKFYVKDFMIGTMTLTSEELGGYLRLLMYQWDKGFLPNDDNKLRKISKISKKSLAVIKNKFVCNENNELQNTRLEEERKEVEKLARRASTNGLKGGRPKGQNKPIAFEQVNQEESYRLDAGNPQLTQNKTNQNQNQNNTSVLSRAQGFGGQNSFPAAPGIPTIQQVEEWFFQAGLADKEQALRFWNYHDGLGWKKGNTPITNAKSLVNNWVDQEKKKQAETAAGSAGKMVRLRGHMGQEVFWTLEQYQQWVNSGGEGYKFMNYV